MWLMTFDTSFPVFFPSSLYTSRTPFLELNKAEMSYSSIRVEAAVDTAVSH